MRVRLLAFAQAAELAGFREREVECNSHETPRQLLERIAPALAVQTFRVAIDHEYRDWDAPLEGARELAVIPPVSGG